MSQLIWTICTLIWCFFSCWNTRWRQDSVLEAIRVSSPLAYVCALFKDARFWRVDQTDLWRRHSSCTALCTLLLLSIFQIANKFNSDHFSGQEPFKVVQLRDGLFCRSTRIPRGCFSFAMKEFLNLFFYFQRIRMNEDERLIRLMDEVWEMKWKSTICCTARSSKVKMKPHKNHLLSFTRLSILLSPFVFISLLHSLHYCWNSLKQVKWSLQLVHYLLLRLIKFAK